MRVGLSRKVNVALRTDQSKAMDIVAHQAQVGWEVLVGRHVRGVEPGVTYIMRVFVAPIKHGTEQPASHVLADQPQMALQDAVVRIVASPLLTDHARRLVADKLLAQVRFAVVLHYLVA